MKIYLQNIVNELKMFSQSLDKQSILVNKPWALIDSDLGIQKLIFKKNNELILSKDGQVTEGKWDYFPEAKCLLIDRGADKILCNETYIDDSILVLKVDGKSDSFFVLANENNIPDLDAYGYLHMLYENKYNVGITYLEDGRILKMIPNLMEIIGIGSKVSIDNTPVNEGEFITKDKKKKYRVKDNKIDCIFYCVNYQSDNGELVVVEQSNKYAIQPGDCIYFQNNIVINNVIVIPAIGLKLFVENSKISKIVYIKNYGFIDGNRLVIEQNNKIEYKEGDKVFINNTLAPDGIYIIDNDSNIKVKEGLIIRVSSFTRSDLVYLFIAFFMVIIFIIFIITDVHN